MLTLNENFFSDLCTLLSGSVPLLNSTSEYRVLRKLIAEANSLSRAWLQEPDSEAAAILSKSLSGAWLECHQWLLREMKNNALWSPEYLGWLAYTSLYVPESTWQSFALSFRLLDYCLEQMPADTTGDTQKSFTESLGRLSALISDESTEPLLLSPLMETALLNDLSLKEIKTDNQRQAIPDRFSPDNLDSLQSLAVLLEKLPWHFNRFGRTIHIKKICSVINDAISILSQCVSTLQFAEGDNSGCHQSSDCTEERNMSATEPAGHPKAMNRDSARDNLQKLITFFRQTEPHSPVSWQLETALKWLDLSFPELLLRMAGEQQELHQDICRRLGMTDAALIGEKSDN